MDAGHGEEAEHPSGNGRLIPRGPAGARVVVLSRRSPPRYYFVNRLAERCPVRGIVFERGRWSRIPRAAWRRARRLGWWTVAGQTAFHLYAAAYRRTAGRRDLSRLLGTELTRGVRDRSIPVLDVEDINGEAVIGFLRALGADLLVVNGTSVLTPRVFRYRPEVQALNFHVGITPAYRGVHGGFWALWEGRPDRCGVTVHRVDAGIDTGEILAQRLVDVDPSRETFWSVYLKQVKVGADLMIDTLAQVAAGTARPMVPDAGPSRLLYHPTLAEYLRYLARRSP